MKRDMDLVRSLLLEMEDLSQDQMDIRENHLWLIPDAELLSTSHISAAYCLFTRSLFLKAFRTKNPIMIAAMTIPMVGSIRLPPSLCVASAF